MRDRDTCLFSMLASESVRRDVASQTLLSSLSSGNNWLTSYTNPPLFVLPLQLIRFLLCLIVRESEVFFVLNHLCYYIFHGTPQPYYSSRGFMSDYKCELIWKFLIKSHEKKRIPSQCRNQKLLEWEGNPVKGKKETKLCLSKHMQEVKKFFDFLWKFTESSLEKIIWG